MSGQTIKKVNLVKQEMLEFKVQERLDNSAGVIHCTRIATNEYLGLFTYSIEKGNMTNFAVVSGLTQEELAILENYQHWFLVEIAKRKGIEVDNGIGTDVSFDIEIDKGDGSKPIKLKL